MGGGLSITTRQPGWFSKLLVGRWVFVQRKEVVCTKLFTKAATSS
jgi:hypothetical protein